MAGADRHKVKPLAYVRYGDDFVLFCRTQAEAERTRTISIERLAQLGLRINDTQDRIIRSWQGLHFLGHVVNKDNSTVSRKTKNLMLRRINLQNISSYSSLRVDDDVKRLLPWLINLR